MYFGEKKKDSGKRLKKCGMRDFREKGAGMRDQYSALPFKKCEEKSFAKIPEIKQEYFYNNRYPTIPSVVYISGALAQWSTMGKKMW